MFDFSISFEIQYDLNFFDIDLVNGLVFGSIRLRKDYARGGLKCERNDRNGALSFAVVLK